MIKFLKAITIIILTLAAIFLILLATFLIITKDAKLNDEKLGANQHVTIFDEDGNEIINTTNSSNNQKINLSELNQHTINAFIASEDRKFYSHNGLNYKRMFKALYKNIVSASFKEGASTISQQLIKNTHLSNDKTIKRKLNEIRLTLQLEKKYSKDDILEMYLNTIYFGHKCYGLASAAKFYFDKKAEDLSLTESATIVGLLASPNNYSPFKNEEKCLSRRNLVLKSMLACEYITNESYENAISQPLETVTPHVADNYSGYINAVFDELGELNFDFYELNSDCKIFTYMNKDAQKYLESLKYDTDNSAIIIDNLTGGINAYTSTVSNSKRQIGSTAKPLFVYAPSIEENLLMPFTKILDEKIDFNGYSPENFDKNYHGYVTVKKSIAESLNVPAVKALNALTLKKCEKYLNLMDINLEEDEKNLTLALGCMKYGLSLANLCEKYTIFPNGGTYIPSRFIKKIVSKDGVTLYENNAKSSKVFSSGTCSLINEMLLETSKTGTAKVLKDLPFAVASKTGTCGTEEGNTDAYTVSYTGDKTYGVWLGDKNNKKTQISSSGDCCKIIKKILENQYAQSSPLPLNTNEGTSISEIDLEEYELNNRIVLADSACPKLNRLSVKTTKGCEPTQKSTRFLYPQIAVPEIKVENNTVNIKLCQTKYYLYEIFRHNNDKKTLIYDGTWKKSIKDYPTEGYYTYSVIPYYIDSEGNKNIGKEVTLPIISINKNNSTPQKNKPNIIIKDWFNQ